MTAGDADWLLDGDYSANFEFTNFAVANSWMMFDFQVPAIVDEAKWYQGGTDNRGIWKWQGSNDDSTWYDIGSPFTLGGATTQVQTQLNGNTTAYRYLRLFGISGNANDSGLLEEIEFKITYNANNVTTSYGNTGGVGNRSSLITVTSNISILSGSVATLVDGSLSNGLWPNNQGASGKYFRFDYGAGASKVINEARLSLNGPTTLGTWKWQGSNDGTNWSDIGSSFSMDGVDPVVMTSMAGNTTGYRYYQLLGLSGTLNSDYRYMQEIIFSIGDAAVVHTYDLTTVCAAVSAVSTPILAVTRSLTSSPAAVSATSTPNLAVQRALATLAAALSATSDINLSTNAIRDLVTTCAAQSQTSNPVLGVARPLNSSMAAQTQTSAIILAILRVLTTTLSARTYTPDTILKVLRSLVTTIAAQSTVSSPVLTMLHRLVTVAAAGTSTSAVALAVLRPLVATIAAQTATSDVVLRTSPYLDLTTICAALTQTSDIDLILTFYESLLSKAKRFYGPVSAADLEAAALQWLETEPATLLPAALQWVVVGEEKEENQ